MAESIKPGPIGQLLNSLLYPARSGGPLGRLDQSDPNVTSLLGDTLGPLGFNDWADPFIQTHYPFDLVPMAGGICKAPGGMPIVVGSDAANKKSEAPSSNDVPLETQEADLEQWEGKYPYMYLDTNGYVTVGIGQMLPDANAAKKLGFVRRKDQTVATDEEIETDFNNVSDQVKGMKATYYKKYTALDLPDTAIYALLQKVIEECNDALTSSFTGFDTYPAAAKRALLDMQYNLGTTKLGKFTDLKKAVEAQDWKTASKQCHRKGPSAERNDWTRDKFLEAAQADKK